MRPPDAKTRVLAALRQVAIGKATGLVFGWGFRLYAAIFLGAGAVFLALGWKAGPEPLLKARQFAALTATAEGRFVDSWLAIDFDPARVGPAGFWRASAKASPCAVIEFDAGAASPVRRAFCGPRIGFNESYGLHDLAEIGPGVAFDWPREANGLAMPQARFSPAAYQWLATSPPPASDRGPGVPATMLGVLEREVDRPAEVAIASWARPAPVLALRFDPARPEGAMPAGYVEARLDAGSAWVVSLLPLAAGTFLWWIGMGIFLPAMAPWGRAIFALAPLVLLPAWGDVLPRNLARIQPDVAGVIGDMLDNVASVDRLVASAPEDATLVDGETMRWRVGGGAYAETLGRVRLAKPVPAPVDADAALEALVAQVTREVRAMPPAERAALYRRLSALKTGGRTGDGLLFLAAARQDALDAGAPPESRRAAGDFLSDWVTQPVPEPWPAEPGFRVRVRLFESLADVPVVGVPVLSASIAERARGRAALAHEAVR